MSKFYTVTPKGGIVISKYGLRKFVESLGYAKHYISSEKTTTPIYIYKSGRIIEPVIPIRVHEAVINALESGAYSPGLIPTEDVPKIIDKLVETKIITSNELLITMDELDKPIISDTKDSAIFVFRNGVVTATKDDIKLSATDSIDGYIWASDIIEFDFEPAPFEEAQKSDFYRLIYNVTSSRTPHGWRKNEKRFMSLYTMLGYLLHAYKDPSNPRAVILMDQSADGTAMGRTCKGLLVYALGFLRKSITLDGKCFDENDKFSYNRVTIATRLLFLDDVGKKFNFEKFFSIVTEGIKIEEKYVKSFYIPFKKSPKIVISTNYALNGTGSSHEARKYEFALSNYYSSKHRPIDEFGKRFFDEWDANQWNCFYTLMLFAVKAYLNHGVTIYSDPIIEEKKLLTETSQEFVEWVHDQNLQLGQRYESSEIYDRFIRHTESTADRKTFAGYLRSFAQANGWVLDQAHSGSVRYMEFKSR